MGGALQGEQGLGGPDRFRPEPGLALRVATQREAGPEEQFLLSSFPKQTGRQGALLVSVLVCFCRQDSEQPKGPLRLCFWAALVRDGQERDKIGAVGPATSWGQQGALGCERAEKGSSQREAGSGDNGFTVGGLSSQEMFPWHPGMSMVTLCGRPWVQPLPCGGKTVGGREPCSLVPGKCPLGTTLWGGRQGMEPTHHSSADKGEAVGCSQDSSG